MGYACPHGRSHRTHQDFARIPPAENADQRREGAHGPPEAAHRGGLRLRRDRQPRRALGAGLRLFEARGRPGHVRACQGDRPESHRRGSQRSAAPLHEAALGGRLHGAKRHGRAGDRPVRRRTLGHEGEARESAAREAPRIASRIGAVLQHVGRVPLFSTRGSARKRGQAAGTRHWRHQDQGGASRSRGGPAARERGAQAPGRRLPAHGGCEPAVGPPRGASHGTRTRALRPRVDRGAAGCVGQRRARRAGRDARHARGHRRDAHELLRACAPHQLGCVRLRAARLPARWRRHALHADPRACRPQGPQARAALRDGDPRAPGRGLSARAMARALRLAGAALQRAPRARRRAHEGARSPRRGIQPERTGAPGRARASRSVNRTEKRFAPRRDARRMDYSCALAVNSPGGESK